MTRNEAIKLFKTSMPYGQKLFVVWTVGKSKDIHINCDPRILRSCEKVADKVIEQSGQGQRFASFRHSVGQLGLKQEACFCFRVRK